jgi:hypothetical protein
MAKSEKPKKSPVTKKVENESAPKASSRSKKKEEDDDDFEIGRAHV